MGVLTCRIEARQLKLKLKRALQASPAARHAGVQVLAGRVVERISQTAPRDTNRYVRGWIQAGNAAGVTELAVPAINRGSLADTIAKKVAKKYRQWQFYVSRYERTGRNDKWYRRAVKQRDKFKAMLESLTGTEIAFNVFGGDRDISIRHKVYGGTGRIVRVGDRTYVELHNREAHATIVERKHGTLRKAHSAFYGVGLHKAGNTYLRMVRTASALHAAAGAA